MNAFQAVESIYLWIFGMMGTGIVGVGIAVYQTRNDVSRLRSEMENLREKASEALGVRSLVNSVAWKERTDGRLNLIDDRLKTVDRDVDRARDEGAMEHAAIHERVTKQRDERDDQFTAIREELTTIRESQARTEAVVNRRLHD